MKRTAITDTLPGWLQWSVFAGLAMIIVLMPFHAFLSTWAGSVWGNMDFWKAWKELLLVLLSIPLVAWLSVRPRRWRMLLRDPLAWWIVAFIVVLVFLGLLHVEDNGRQALLTGLASSGRYFLIFTLAYTLFTFGNWNWLTIRRWATKYVVAAGMAVAIFGIIQVLFLPLDFLSQFGYDKETTIAPYTLIDDNSDAPRAFATLRGPNDFGAYLILPLLLTIIFARSSRWWLIGSGVLLLALFESSSRSAWIGALIAVTSLLILSYSGHVLKSRRWQVAMLGSIVLAAVIGVAAISIPSVRLEIFHSSPGDSSLTEGSTSDHWLATTGGIQRVLANPLGCGAGCAGPASYYGEHPKISESYPVQIAEEAGISGLILWIGICVMVARRLWGNRSDYLAAALLASFIGISAIALWLHTWADDPLSLTWWGLAGAILGYYAGVRYDNHEQLTDKKPTSSKHAKQKTKKEAVEARR